MAPGRRPPAKEPCSSYALRTSLASGRLSFNICYRYGLLKVTEDGKPLTTPSGIVSQCSRP